MPKSSTGAPAKSAPARKRPTRVLQLGPWLTRLGKKPVEVAKKVGIGESYMSTLISGKKKGTPSLLVDISEALGLTVNDLYRMPPSTEMMETVEAMTPAQMAALAQALEKINGRKTQQKP